MAIPILRPGVGAVKCLVTLFCGLLISWQLSAVNTQFFGLAQDTQWITNDTTTDILLSEGYEFTVTRDKLFTGGVGMTNPIGRRLRIPWPQGLEAQALTAGPSPGGAKIVIRREDRLPFAVQSFTAALLANTAGAGGTLEIMPLLNGEDGVPNPFAYDATGYSGNRFTYTTPELTNFDTYLITLYVDFALTGISLVDASLPPPVLELFPTGNTTLSLAWSLDALGYKPEVTTSLTNANWQPVTSGVLVEGDRFVVPVEATERQQFYRLRK
ncbi:MAG: hypothetical protein RIS76_4441 [Verrucomicrobiota bacterium]|jgi:hypothetical protein